MLEAVPEPSGKAVWINPITIVTVEPSYKDKKDGLLYTRVTDVCNRNLIISMSDGAIRVLIERALGLYGRQDYYGKEN